ncbi:uncharacterized protein LOC132740890 [Ruditapes philippinarum]|uniref:uncharacterized protein LOC132740890 n=1 Tax=Ruditapes philippinarum TaxID=129788 RepID=UPI00295B17B0|nr:uncharacterized protein LOC132740890 [Ruditapes philippinarum]
MNSSCGQPVTVRFIDLHRDCVDFAVNIFEYVFPTLAIAVTTINILIIIVFTKPHMRSHTTFILTLIACVEIINILCPTSMFSFLYLRGNYKEYLTSEQIQWSYILGKICVDMFNMISLWLTVLLAFVRCKCINSQFISRKVHSTKQIVIYVTLILVIVIVVNAPAFYIFEFYSIEKVDPITNLTREIGVLVESQGIYFRSCSGRKIHLFIEMITDSILPCIILICCNAKIIMALRKAKTTRTILRHKESFKNPSGEKQTCKTMKSTSSELINCSATGSKENTFSDNTKYMASVSVGNDSKDVIQNGTGKNGLMEHKVLLRNVKLHNFCTFQTRHLRARMYSDSTLDKLDKESERTSLLILLVSTIILLHELPLAVLNIVTLARSIDKPLPMSRGCLSIIILLWQFITYPAIFLIYACMCKAFRRELIKTLTCWCKRHNSKRQIRRKPASCPASIKTKQVENGGTNVKCHFRRNSL